TDASPDKAVCQMSDTDSHSQCNHPTPFRCDDSVNRSFTSSSSPAYSAQSVNKHRSTVHQGSASSKLRDLQ
ncbi:hypothetical protein SARC_12784, partial [Sphaeroforma arctica JP610]